MRVLSGFLTFVLCVGLPVAGLLAVTAIAGTPVTISWTLAYTGAVVLGLVMTAYGIVAAWLGTYDLTTGKGWLMLLVDLTWSLPNTVFGAVTGLWLYAFFGRPSAANSAGRGWITFAARGTSGFGVLILKAAGARTTAHLSPPSSSAVSGFWGWIYFATPFEVWAYAAGNP